MAFRDLSPLFSQLKTKFKETQFFLLEAHCGKPNLRPVPTDKKIVFIQEHWQGAENGAMYEAVKASYCLNKDIKPSVFSIGNDCYEVSFSQDCENQVDEKYKNAIMPVLQRILHHHEEDLNETWIFINTGRSYPIGDRLLDLGLNVINLQRSQPGFEKIERLRHKRCKSFSMVYSNDKFLRK